MVNFQQFVESITSESVRKQAYRKRAKEGQEWDIVPNERQNSDEQARVGGLVGSSVVQGKRQGDSSSVTLEGQTRRSDVTSESQENPSEVQEIDKEVTYVPRPLIEVGENVVDNDVPIFKKPAKLKLPKKSTKNNSATAQTSPPNENEPKTSITHAVNEESMK